MKTETKKNQVQKTSKVVAMVFPSIDKKPRTEIAEFSDQIIASSQDNNNMLASGNVHFFVRSHYVDVANGVYGIESLIRSILTENNAVFPKNAENTKIRNLVIAAGMLVEEIEEIVRNRFGFDRYPTQTLRDYLSRFAKNIGCVQMTGKEDKGRPCPRPRCRYYLIES